MSKQVEVELLDGTVVKKSVKDAVLMEVLCKGQIVGGRPVFKATSEVVKSKTKKK